MSSAPPSHRAGRTSAAGQAQGDPATAVVQYYQLLPGNTDAAWTLLTRKFQQGRAGGRATYDQYWGSVRSVRATDAQTLGPDRAVATIHYVYRDGRRAAERTVFTFKRQDGVLKIDRTQTGG